MSNTIDTQAIQNHSTYSLLRSLWSHIQLGRKRQLLLIVLLMIVTSCSEVISIGAVLPFLTALMTPNRIFEYAAIKPLLHFFDLSDPRQILFPLTVLLCITAVLAGGMRLLLLWSSTKLSFSIGADLGIDIYRKTLHQPYEAHLSRNTSELIAGISIKTNAVIYEIIVPIMMIVSASTMLIGIVCVLVFIDPYFAVASFIGFGFIYSCIIHLTRKRLMVNSGVVACETTASIRALQEGLGGIRDVLLDGSQDLYSQIYRRADLALRNAQGQNLFIQQAPRYAMEALGMLLIAVLAYFLAMKSDGIAMAVPILGAMTLGAQRLLPLLQQIYGNYSHVRSGQSSLRDTLDLLNQPMPSHVFLRPNVKMPFEELIHLKNISFSYRGDCTPVIQNLSLIINKGDRIGLIGPSGSGKSTLTDILMALLSPVSGDMSVDGQKINLGNSGFWQANIAHVPQSIYLADASIKENIAFGVPECDINFERVRTAAQQAQLSEVIEGWNNKYETSVGERGIRLSGGQRQRIGIARALYKQASVIIFDEATSALDNETEDAVMRAIDGLSPDLTLIMVAHRVTTLKKCNKIIELVDGRIKFVGDYLSISSR